MEFRSLAYGTWIVPPNLYSYSALLNFYDRIIGLDLDFLESMMDQRHSKGPWSHETLLEIG